MTITQIFRLRSLAGMWGAICCLLFFVCAFDAIISQIRQPLNLIELVPGASEKINFTLKEKTESVEGFTYQSSSDLLSVSFDSVHKGFWLGGYMCQGTIISKPSTSVGDHNLNIFVKGTKAPIQNFKIRVYRDNQDYRLNSKSFIHRNFAFSPWWAMVFCVGLIVVSSGGVFYLSRKQEQIMALNGQAEIYQVIRKDTGCEIGFAMGKKHGLEPETNLIIYDDKGISIGKANVISVTYEDAVAAVNSQKDVKPGYLVSIDDIQNFKTS